MKKLVLVEKNHLIRLGLHRLLDGISTKWEIIPLEIDDIQKVLHADWNADLVVLGLPPDQYEGERIVTAIKKGLHPARILLLSERSASWTPLECGAGSIYACIDKKATPDTLKLAVQLGMTYSESLSDESNSDVDQRDSPLLPKTTPDSECDFLHYDHMGIQNSPQPKNMDTAQSEEKLTEAPSFYETPYLGEFDKAHGVTAESVHITPRQHEVLKLLARGYPIKMVARMMNIAPATAKAHTASLYRQLKVNNRGEAVCIARQKGVPLN